MITRQATGPLQAISRWHWPYRKTLHAARRLPQLPLAHVHAVSVQPLAQKEPLVQPLVHFVHSLWQSM